MSVASTGSQAWQETFRFADLLTRAAERDPDHEAIVFPGERITYGELRDRAFTVARSLLGLGIGQRGPVGILMPNCLEFVELLFGISLLGGRDGADQRALRAAGARLRDRATATWRSSSPTTCVADHVDYVGAAARGAPALADRPTRWISMSRRAPALRTVVLLGERLAPGMLTQERFATAAERVTRRRGAGRATCGRRSATRR